MCPLERGAAEDPAREAYGPLLQHSLAAASTSTSAGVVAQIAPEEGGAETNVNEALKEQLREALQAAQKWQALHSQLHQFCVEQVLPAASTPG